PKIGFNGPFPGKVICSNAGFRDGFNAGKAPYISVTLIDLGQIRESDTRDPVIAYSTIRCPDLEVIEPGGGFLHKFIARRHPAYCNGWEKTVLPAWLEVF